MTRRTKHALPLLPTLNKLIPFLTSTLIHNSYLFTSSFQLCTDPNKNSSSSIPPHLRRLSLITSSLSPNSESRQGLKLQLHTDHYVPNAKCNMQIESGGIWRRLYLPLLPLSPFPPSSSHLIPQLPSHS
jgi:hypothetical protein